MMPFRIDPEFQSLLPPLRDDERNALEEQLSKEGCRDPLVVWSGILLDGHTRREICERRGIPYKVVEIKLSSRAMAVAWVIEHQRGRRNLSDYQWAELALKLKAELAAEAEARMKTGKASDDPRLRADEGSPTKAHEARRTDSILAKTAGVGRDTIRKAEVIAEKAVEPVKQLAREGKVSVRAAAAVATLPKSEQKRVATEGPKAVKEKAQQILKGEDKPAAPDAPPWAGFEAEVKDICSDLTSASRRLGKALGYDAKTKQLQCRWAHFYSHAGTVGQINAIVRNLEINLPAAADPKPPGFIPLRSMKSREATAAGK